MGVFNRPCQVYLRNIWLQQGSQVSVGAWVWTWAPWHRGGKMWFQPNHFLGFQR